MHAIDTMKGLSVMVGEIGCGKTLLARKLLETLEKDNRYEPALMVIVHSEITAEWLLKKIAAQLGVKDPGDKKAVILPQLYERLMELYDQERKAVVIIDEANMLLTREIFEEFRGLLNLEAPGHKLLSINLIGLPELEQNIALDPPLQQRIALKFTLQSLQESDVAEYIKHRVAIAGCQRDLFTGGAYKKIFHYSKGIPRLINTVCDNCLLEGYLIKKDTVDEDIVDGVGSDLGLKPSA
ncbi:AAA family ATPase [candidate division FCPU426 bacterium]|nr:AAA family ATPase [candidate division FCPU426 bacterium]